MRGDASFLRVRVNAQLIDGETGAHLWAERFEENVTDLFKLQDQVVARLANTLGYELVKAEAQRSTYSTNPDAIDLTMRGWAAHWQPPTEESITSARDYFERAIKLDPQNAEAMVGLAYARSRAGFYGWSTAAEDKPASNRNPNPACSTCPSLRSPSESSQRPTASDRNRHLGHAPINL
jgi:adenylate cyclase